MFEISQPRFELVPGFRRALAEGFPAGKSIAKLTEASTDAEFLHNLLHPSPIVELPNGSQVARVPETRFWRHDCDTFIGSVSLRHYLTPELEMTGCHIGYAVHAPFRNQGHAKALLRHALEVAHERGIERVLITALADNTASQRVIEACGGQLLDELAAPAYEACRILRRYTFT